MAARNAKPTISSDPEAEIEWTFIDADDGTIETRKDSVTYRKPTYSEILKGVAAEDLEEVESEPEFEVLASFKFRPKGESFGLGSSAPKATTCPKSKRKQSRHGADDDEEDKSSNGDDTCSSDDGIMIISSQFKSEKVDDNGCDIDEASKNAASSQTSNERECDADDKINKSVNFDDCCDDAHDAVESVDGDRNDDDKTVVVKELYDNDSDDDYVIADDAESDADEDNTADPDDDDDDDDERQENAKSDEEVITESTCNLDNSPNESTITESKEQLLNEPVHDEENDVEPVASDDSDDSEKGFLDLHKGGLCDNPCKELAWDSLTFQFLSTLPRMNESATSINPDDNENLDNQSGIDNIADSDNEHSSDSSFAAISQDDTVDSSSFDVIGESADIIDSDFCRTDPIIPHWFFDANYNVEELDESFDDDTDYIISDLEDIDFEELNPIIPHWFFDANYNVEDLDESFEDDTNYISDLQDIDFEEPNPIIPHCFFDANYKVKDLDESFHDDTDYSDSEFDSDSDFDEASAMAIPRWLFDENFKHPEKEEEGCFLSSHLFVDIQTFIILLCLTTALGFSIGHGLTVYFSGHAPSTKLPESGASQRLFSSPLEDLGLTAEEVAKIDLLKLEDELYRQKDSEMLSEHLRFDLRELYKNLQEKHYRLLRNQKSTEKRLHISKSMNWFWRLKHDSEKRRNRKTSSSTILHKHLKDMGALYAKEKMLANKWRKFKKNYFARGPKETKFVKSNLRWLVNPLDAKLNEHKVNKTKAEMANRLWIKAIMTLSKSLDMKDFKRRWTQDFKDLKRKSCSDSTHSNKSTVSKKKASFRVSNPFVWVNNGRHCKRAHKNDTLGRCLKNGPVLKKIKNGFSKQENQGNKRFEKMTKEKRFVPCFTKPKKSKDKLASSDNKSVSARNKIRFALTKVRKPSKGESTRRSHRHEEIRKDRIKKRESRRKALEVKTQVNELKLVLAELRSERRKAEKEKAQLEASWRRLKRQRLQFEKERIEREKTDKKKLKKVKSKLQRAKTRLKTWKKVAKKAQKKVLGFNHDAERVSLAKQRLEDVKSIKKELKLEKRKLRKQRKNLKSVKQQLRQEHRNYAREKWKTKKKLRQLERQERLKHRAQSPFEKQNKMKNKRKSRNNFKKKNRRGPHVKQGQNDQKGYWEKLEKSLYEWAQKVNRTVEHHRRGKGNRIWNKLQEQFRKLIDWTTRKNSKPTGPVKKKKKRKSKSKDVIHEKVLAEQMKFDDAKRNSLKNDSENQLKLKKRKTKKDKERKKRKTKDPDALLKQRRRKQRRKFQRELERLQQWALQMNEKKLEHENMYREKVNKKPKCLKARRNAKSKIEKEEIKGPKSFSNNRALVSVEDTNNTLMLLLQPQFGDARSNSAKPNRKEENTKWQDEENIILDVAKSQLNHELSKKKSADTSLTLPVNDDVILPAPNDINKDSEFEQNPLGLPSFARDALTSNAELMPPSMGPTFYKEFPILKIMEKINPKRDDIGDVFGVLPPDMSKVSRSSDNDGNDQQMKPWYMRRAEQRDIFRDNDPALTWFPRPGPLKSDGTWFFRRSTDRAEQRQLYEPLNRQSARDGFKHNSWRSHFHREGSGRRRKELKDGKWIFDRASDRAEQRSNNEPWYTRRSEGREHDREENQDSWFIERGYYRDQLHDYDDNDEDDDLLNDYDDYASDFDENEDHSWP